MSHTPTPWRVYEVTCMIVRDVAGQPVIAETTREDGRENDANAAFIVKACNAHDELVAALEQIVAADAITAHKIARAALAKVTK